MNGNNAYHFELLDCYVPVEIAPPNSLPTEESMCARFCCEVPVRRANLKRFEDNIRLHPKRAVVPIEKNKVSPKDHQMIR